MMSSISCNENVIADADYFRLHRRCRPTTSRVCAFFLTLFFVVAFDVNVATARRDHDDDGTTRQREHFDEILLRPDPYGNDDNSQSTQEVLQALRRIYHEKIKPVEEQFQYADLRRHVMSEADIHSKPIVLVVGPWSTGKSTLINYILGIEDQLERLYTGAEPTTADFTVLSYGDDYRTIEGLVLATDSSKPFSSMEKFGQTFLEHLLGIEINAPLLRNVTFIDTPGILENRRQQERGYPYNDVMRWLVHRSDLIFVIFDPTKLDVGFELETLFKQLKGKESVIRIILNKADSMNEQELMRVYGALFWSLSPLINVTEAPRVYVGSFWSQPYSDEELGDVLLEEEKSLLNDMYEVIRNRIYNKIAFLRQHAIRVRIHALLVDSYVAQYRKQKSLFRLYDETLAKQICRDPIKFNVYKTILSHPNVSEYDLPEPDEYEEFFRINPLSEQKRLNDLRSYFSKKGPLDKLNEAISQDLPRLLQRYQRGELDNNKNWCKTRKSGIPCFGDVASDLWTMQKRYPNAGRDYDEDEEAVAKPVSKYRKVKQREVVEEAEESEIEEEQAEEIEEEEIVEIVQSKPIKPVVEKPPVKVVSSVKRKGKPKVEVKAIVEEVDEEAEKESEGDEESAEFDEKLSITKPIKTVSVAERVEEEVRQETETVKIVAETTQTKQEDIDTIKIVKVHQRQDDVKPKSKTEQKPEAKASKLEVPATKPPMPEKRPQPVDDAVKTKQTSTGGKQPKAVPPSPDTLKKVQPVVPPTGKESLSLPTASAGHVKKPSDKQHPSVEELIEEDDKKAHPCSKYRKNCDYKIRSDAKEKIKDSSKSADTPKCPPYRKSCQTVVGETKKVDKVVGAKVKTQTESKPDVKKSKDKTESVVETEGRKCLPYRKTCQPIVREKEDTDRVKRDAGPRCPPYRKSCKTGDTEQVTKEEKKTEQKPTSASTLTKDGGEKSAKTKDRKEEVAKPKASPAPKSEEAVKINAGVEAKKDESKRDKPKEEDVKEERVSAKYKYRKIREDLPEELKQKLREKLAKQMEAEKEKSGEHVEKAKKCLIYRKSCKVEQAPVVASESWDSLIKAMDYGGKIWDLIFSAHWPSGTSGVKSTTKCLKYRKTCTPVEYGEEESSPEVPVPKKCPPYRKSCKTSDEVEDVVVNKPKPKQRAISSEESRSSEKVHEYGSDENGIPPTQERQKYDSREKESHEFERQKQQQSPPKKESVKKVKDKSVAASEEKKPTKETYRRGVAAETMEEKKLDVETTEERKSNIDEALPMPDDKPVINQQHQERQTVSSVESSSEKSREEIVPKETVPKQPKETVPKQPKETVPKQPKETVPKQPKETVPKQKDADATEKYKKSIKAVKDVEKETAKEKEEPNTKKEPEIKVKLTAREKYRKSPPIVRVDNKIVSKTETPTKCLKYRKSCQNVADALPKETKPATTQKDGSKKSSAEQTAKEKYRKNLADEPIKKCLPYRKSCTIVQSTVESSSESKFTPTPDKHRQYRKDQPTKCLPYRKSCQNNKADDDRVVNLSSDKSREAPIKDTASAKKSVKSSAEQSRESVKKETASVTRSVKSSVEQTAKEKYRKNVADEATKKCLPYRKSCTVVSKVESSSESLSVSTPDKHRPYRKDQPGKCLPYRKSCRNKEGDADEIVNLSSDKSREAPVKHTASATRKSFSGSTSGSQKCLPYRKSCTVERATTPVDLGKVATGKSATQQSSVSANGHCIKYRKSCNDGQQQQHQQPAKKNLTNKDVIYVIDKETGKQKKLCRKKKNGDASAVGNQVPIAADSLTSKMQNKWKKNAQLDSVMAA